MSAPDISPASAGGETRAEPLVELKGITKNYAGSRIFGRSAAAIQALSGIDLSIYPGTTVGIVGESGCGKSTLGKVLVGLEQPTEGEVRLRGRLTEAMSRPERKAARYDIQMTFQDSYSALNPRMSIARIIEEPLKAMGGLSRPERRARVEQLVREVGLGARQMGQYPKELSGGQRQRVGLARALATNAALIVADEPVSALDVSIRSQILNLMVELQAEHQLSYLMVSHDLAVIHFMADHVAVMYLGKIVESGLPDELFLNPAHHYTRALIDSVPEPTPHRNQERSQAIKGEVPSAADPPSGCRFRTRCPAALALCAEVEPPLRSFGATHLAACHFPLITPA
jgi:peptide/nickel transport system ATP-binding protein